ncbi:chemotaxis protein CheV [Planctobacterium marinum]|uniref:chemotaxis protein CheV n=1 Tax=Planctobacterium marinum TaxID=1631968 RepID=UPI001E364518|nr:chemotaxis protein CheV [Planctobacterium marinum]MCC2606341.1 chemotaxis protein CheV [Planctobacterium marinum]
MSGLLASVDQRTKLVGENRLELLLFRLNSQQIFAMNVFKVREVIPVPQMIQMPGSHEHLCGVASLRGLSVPIVDLRRAIKMPPSPLGDNRNVIITEYNRTVQGFLIGPVLSITNLSWAEILPPPNSAGKNNYLTAFTQIDLEGRKQIVEIIDVEKVLAEIVSYDIKVSKEILDDEVNEHLKGKRVLIVDDSNTARQQIKESLKQVGIEVIERQDGLQALRLLKQWADQGKSINDEILMMFTDAEMPEMDGYMLTAEVRADARLKDLFITLNTSLSGNFNEAMVEKVGCNRFISKFQPDMLIKCAQERMREVLEGKR